MPLRQLLAALLAGFLGAQDWECLDLPAKPLAVLSTPTPYLLFPDGLRPLHLAPGKPRLGKAAPLPEWALFFQVEPEGLSVLTARSRWLRFTAPEGWTTVAVTPPPDLPLPPVPLAAPFVAGGRAFVPTRKGYAAVDPEGQTTVYPLPPAGELVLGDGDGTAALAGRRTVPLPRAADLDGEGHEDLLLIYPDRVLLWARDGKRVTLCLPPRAPGTRFLHVRLPPLCADLDGDGRVDLLLPDPHGGRLTWLRGDLLAGGRPARHWRFEGTLLRVTLQPLEEEAPPAVVVLVAPPLNLFRAARVFLTGMLPARLLVLPSRAGEGPAAAPRWSFQGALPLGVEKGWDRPRPAPRYPLAWGRGPGGILRCYWAGTRKLAVYTLAAGRVPKRTFPLPARPARLWVLPGPRGDLLAWTDESGRRLYVRRVP